MTFANKIKRSREIAGLTQQELADAVGVSKRAIAAYETGGAIARHSTAEKLGAALNVSVRFLMDESCSDPLAEIEKDTYAEQASLLYGAKGARDINELLKETKTLFAGGTISEEEKDTFFRAVMAAYLACKEESRKKFGRKSAE